MREPGAALCSPGHVREYLRLQLADDDRACFGVLFLDVLNRVIAFEELFEGSLSQATVYPREVVKRVLQLNAAAAIVAHNHPSGVAEPSCADEHLTAVIRAALRCVDVPLIQHLVVGCPDIVSFAERGLMEPRPDPACAARPASSSKARRASAAAAA
jgi:DNA repair protein RadC